VGRGAGPVAGGVVSYEEQVIVATAEDILRRQHEVKIRLLWGGIQIDRGQTPDGRERREVTIYLTELLTPQPYQVRSDG